MDELKQVQLPAGFPLAQVFLDKGISNFYDAMMYVHQLPYRRNSRLGNYQLVLEEACGTCSTKHALIRQLASEVGVNLSLKVGILLMTEKIMPKLKNVLKEYGLHGVPEAHCYLQYNDQRFDLTFPDIISYPKARDFLLEKEVNADEVGEDKVKFHQNFLRKWLLKENLDIPFERLWECREKCIDALSQDDGF